MGDTAFGQLGFSLQISVPDALHSIGKPWSQKCGKLPSVASPNDTVYFPGMIQVPNLIAIPNGLAEFPSGAYKYVGRWFRAGTLFNGDTEASNSDAGARTTPTCEILPPFYPI